MRLLITAGATSLLAVPALATELELKIEVPKIDVAEYHRPYVAIWLERPDNTVAANLAVWYDIANKKNEGDKWLKDLRQWWRKAGRDLKVPADGLTGATRPVGTHTVKFDASHPTLKDLAAGEYQLVVEAAREEGGREVVRIPVTLGKAATLEAKGQSELGALSVSIKP
jgi:hypothetical protein